MIGELITKAKELANTDELHIIGSGHNYRYERKFTMPDSYSSEAIIQQIKSNTYLFREVFYQRQVNNIYFDTEGYGDYFDNVLGVSDRKKIRIRWYGDTFGTIEKPKLEVKLKKGLVGDKWAYRLRPFYLDENITSTSIQEIFRDSNLPVPILEGVKMVFPSLLNSYSRRYYLSADNRYRITVDFNLLYHKIDRRFNNFKVKPVRDENKIIELKYGLEDDHEANVISTQFPFRLNKNSKYVNGINSIKQFPQ